MLYLTRPNEVPMVKNELPLTDLEDMARFSSGIRCECTKERVRSERDIHCNSRRYSEAVVPQLTLILTMTSGD